jgi:hypothetical protein
MYEAFLAHVSELMPQGCRTDSLALHFDTNSHPTNSLFHRSRILSHAALGCNSKSERDWRCDSA